MRYLFWIVAFIIGALLLAACQSGTALNMAEPLVQMVEPAAPEQPAATEAATEAAATAVAIDECLLCHSDKQRLLDTVTQEVEDHEGESSGVG